LDTDIINQNFQFAKLLITKFETLSISLFSTSNCIPKALIPFDFNFSMDSLHFYWVRAVTIIVYPLILNWYADSNPKPLLAPMINATFSISCVFILLTKFTTIYIFGNNITQQYDSYLLKIIKQ